MCQKEKIKDLYRILLSKKKAIPSCPKSLFQSEAKREANNMKMLFYSHLNEIHPITGKFLYLASF